jgi:DNA modification methylase
MSVNKLILGDNLEILKAMEAESVDLIYLDPPFFSNRNYEVIWGDAGEVRSFQDRWAGGVDHYIAWLKERVEQMYRILKPSGSIFLHCDWHANAYIRVDILDKIFGMDNFRNEIVWKRTTAGKPVYNNLPKNSDTIFWYSKTDNYTFSIQIAAFTPADKATFNKDDNDGRGPYNTQPIINPGIRPNLQYTFITKEGKEYPSPKNGWRFNEQRMRELESENRLYFTDKIIREKYYLAERELKGKQVSNVWDDIQNVQSSKEKIGYPTQKPEALLERIIKMASNEGDLALDPFMGGGTTIAVADRLNRQWIGVDQSAMAVKVTELRLQKQAGLFSSPYTVQLHKYDYDTLRYKDAFQFESWIVQQFGGTPNTKQRGDMGLDGKTGDGTPIQVKRSDNIGRNVIDNFKSAVERFDKNLFEKNIAAKKPIGYIIAFSFGKGAVEEVARLKNKEDRIIRLVTVEEIVPIATKPTIGVHINELGKDASDGPSVGNRKIELLAAGQSPAGIEFYSWDFTYDKEKGFKPSIIIDKEGRQIRSFKTGIHAIAVKVMDNDGLENMEIIKLKINGVVEQIQS